MESSRDARPSSTLRSAVRRAKRDRLLRLNGMVPAMHRHFAVGPVSLSHPVVASLRDDRHGGLVVF